jgi:hypothetical protein
MKVTVQQLKALIREAAAEAMEEIKAGEEENLAETKKEEEGAAKEEALHEAVQKAFRAGYQRGVKAATARKATR